MKFFGNFFIFRGGEEVGVSLFIPRTVSKYKIQLLPCKVCATLPGNECFRNVTVMYQRNIRNVNVM